MTKEQVLKQIKLFDENYQTLFSNIDDLDKKYFIGKDKNKVCRFCKKDETKTTFKNVSHAIPEALGNKTIICLDECDECNKRFSETIEDDLDKVTLPFRTINFIKGKKKIPTYRSLDKKTRLEAMNGEKKELKLEYKKDASSFEFNEKNKTAKFIYKQQAHIPANAYKALVKMALSVMPEEKLKLFDIAIQWVYEKDSSKVLMKPLNVYMTFVPGINVYEKTTTFLFYKYSKNTKYLDCLFILCFGNIMYQIAIPSDKEVFFKEQEKSILKFPTPFEIYSPLGKPIFNILDWSEHKMVRDTERFIDFGFNGMTQIVEDGKIINSDILENYPDFKNELNKFTNINLGNS